MWKDQHRTIIGDLPRIHARRHHGSVAYIDGARTLSWGELDDRVNRLAHGLADRFGVRAGDRVAILANNCFQFPEVVFTSSRLGAISTGLNTRHHVNEMIAQMVDSGSKLLVVGEGFDDVGAEIVAKTDAEILFISGGDYEQLIKTSDSTEIAPHGDADAPYALTYTSGTTGEPKGAMITSAGEIAYAQSLAWAAESRREDVCLIVTPMFHKGGQFSMMHPAYLGLPSIIVRTPDPDTIFEAIEVHRATCAVFVPTIMQMLVDARGRDANAGRDISSIRHILYGSNPISVELLRAFAEMFRCSLSQIGGVGTEGGIALVLDRLDHEAALADPSVAHRLRSCGRVQAGFEMRIVDEDDQDVAAGEVGEMVFRGNSFIPGYWNRPEQSDRLWRGGWLHSGDIGRVDEDGYVYYVDRKAGRIKSGGETVYAREVEAVIRQHRSIREVCVTGIPHRTWGEAVSAVVEAVPGHTVDSEELSAFVREHLAGYKVPKRITVVDELPRTALGKIAVGEVKLMAQRAAEGDPRWNI
ncbi:MAG: hypothetical protein CL424_11710 [Acidimicrobiaceae bacterium]|nr:hypothetical protein [Acidimicrobiaceae bacterium]